MATKRTGLGQGIGALIPTAPESGIRPTDLFFTSDTSAKKDLVEVPGARLQLINPNDVVPNAHQPRTEFRAEELAELEHSIREFGVLQPIVVRPMEKPVDGARYELVMGERRLRASKAVGLAEIPAVIRDTADADMLRDALLENIHRAQLNALEEASAYQQLIEDFGITQDELAQRIGRSRPQVTNTLRLLKLPEKVQQRVAAGVLTAGHARAILSLSDRALMEKLANKIVNEDLSVRETEATAAVMAGKPAPGTKATARAGGRTDYLSEIAERLGDKLNTRVSVKLAKAKGTITIEFATVADLNRIVTEIEGHAPSTGVRFE
ncbi:ParB family chromosome partitioning protein [Microbacteriaceae bacterium MWH-Ta3]|nr:ParB family chromosome partitioning protein [Microbacteriaceae bacterium MWH-Ta3]